MLISGTRLIKAPVMSLQTGGEIARTIEPIIDPASLQIVAYAVTGPLVQNNPSYVRIADIRELSDIGFIVDSTDEILLPGDVIQLDTIARYQFSPMGMTVVNQHKRKVGKVIDYTVDIDSFVIIQLTVMRTLFHRLTDTELIIHRSQIIEINDKAIVIKDDADVPEHTRVTTPGSYVNPFRSAKPAADTIDQSSES